MRYEVVQEILNSCEGNRMRDVFIDEIETDDPAAYVRALLAGEEGLELDVQVKDADNITIFAHSNGMIRRFIFTHF